MTKKRGVSGKTHTRQQLNDYANQHNPNNKAYRAIHQNRLEQRRHSKNERYNLGILDGESFGWCDD